MTRIRPQAISGLRGELGVEQIRLLYTYSRSGLSSNIVNALLVCVVLWNAGEPSELLTWLGAIVAITLGRYLLVHRYLRLRPRDEDHPRWLRYFTIGALFSGIAWGAAGSVLLPPHDAAARVLIIFVLGGMTAGAVPYLSPVLRVFVVYVMPALLPLAATLFLTDDLAHTAMAIMVLVYIAMLLANARRSNKIFRESLALRFENRDLVQHLENANEHMQHINTELVTEIEERRRIEAALGLQESRALVTLESISDGVITTDVHGVIDYLNPVAEHLTGWSLREARGRPLVDVLNVIDATSQLPVDDPVSISLREGRLIDVPETATLVNRDGRRYAIEESVAPIRNRGGAIIGAVLAFRDVTQERLLTQQISYQASHDPLTSLINRREFEARLERALLSAHTERIQHVLCYIDLDQFKIVNDSCGHAAGDELLRQIAAHIPAKLRENDCVARLGGDEFGVLLEGCSLEKARHIADDLRATIRDFRFVWEGRTYDVGASIGVVAVTSASGSLAEAMGAADSACYVAKDQGRNRVHVYEQDDGAIAQRSRETQWVARLTRALEENWLELYVQPIQPLSAAVAGQVLSEVLLRMWDENGQLTLPSAFLPAAERYGLMPRIDRWVTRTTFSLVAAGRRSGRYSINLSGQTLGDAGFLDFVLDEFGRTGANPQCICFEITETAAIANLSRAMNLIATLRAQGCQFALDDFGSGLSSFSYLKNLKVDYLKISGHFVRGLLTDEIDRAMVASINQIGHVIGLYTIAEDVETEAVLEQLRQIGLDMAQGSAVAPPTPFAAASMLRQHA